MNSTTWISGNGTSDGMPAKDYEDPVQIQFRILLNKAMVNTFALFEYTYDEVIKKYFP